MIASGWCVRNFIARRMRLWVMIASGCGGLRCRVVLTIVAEVVAGGRVMRAVVSGVVRVTAVVTKCFPAQSFSSIVCNSLALLGGDVVVAVLLETVVVVVGRATCLGGGAVCCVVAVVVIVAGRCSFGAFPEPEPLPIAFLTYGDSAFHVVPKGGGRIDLPCLLPVFPKRRCGVAKEARTLSLTHFQGCGERGDRIGELPVTSLLLLGCTFSGFLPQSDSFV